MARQKISYVDASLALTENRNRREQSRLEAVQKKINEREEMRATLENARDLRFRKEHEHAMRMEAARDDNLSTALKAIYITALDPNSLTEMNLDYANSIVDQYINERGGATNILNGIKCNTYFLSRLTQIIENAAKTDVHNIENMDRDLEKEFEVEGSEPIPEKKNDIHDMEPEAKTDTKEGSPEGSKHDAYEDTPYKDFKPDGENGNFKQQNEGMKTESTSLDVELFDESFLLEADDNSTEKKEEKSDDDKSDIDVKSDGGDVNIKISNSKDDDKDEKDDEDEEEVETSEPEEDSDNDDEDDDQEDESEEESGETEIEDTDDKDDEELDEEIEVDKEDDDEPESAEEAPEGEEENDEEVDAETEKEVEDTEVPDDEDTDVEDIDGDGEPDDQDDEDIEDVESGEEPDEDEEASEDDDVKDVVGDDIDGSDIDSDDSIDGTDERGTLFKDLEDEPDVRKAIEIIRDRISDAEETFIKNNAKDKEAISKLVDKISNNVKTVEDAGEDSKEGKIAQESARCLDRYRKDIQSGRPVMSIFEIITRKLNGSMLKNKQVLESYKDEDTGKLDEGLIIESARCVFGWLETVNTLKLEKVDEAFIENILTKL